MKEAPFIVDLNEEDENQVVKEKITKYLRFWPWFLVAIVLCVGGGYLYMRYAPVTYESFAKIKIIDDTKELNVATDAESLLSGSANINLDNEIEVLKSYRLLNQVVEELKLDVEFYQVGNVKTSQIWEIPFEINKFIHEDSLTNTMAYEITMGMPEITIADEQGQQYSLNLTYSGNPGDKLPFEITFLEDVDYREYLGITYKIVLIPVKEAVLKLSRELQVQPTNKNSEILTLSIKGESVDRSEAILNTLITKFDEDGILDRQLVSQRTLEVIDKRFVDLTGELDSIEVGKQDFKQANKLSYIEADAGLTLQKKSETEDEVSNLENQISISKLLKETVINQAEYSLLPADIGLENLSLNSLVANYNELALEREKLLPNVGVNHPTLRSISGQLERAKVNILKSVNIYQAQLRTSMRQLNRKRNIAGAVFSELPEKEKLLRAIERQQSIKEKLFLLLLQKREEAAINLATTSPSVKVVDYGLTSSRPLSPRRSIVYPLSLMLGVFLPFIVLFIRFSLDTKVQDRADLEKLSPDIPIIGEIPFIKGHKGIKGINDRSTLAESFRMLCTSINYNLKTKKKKTGNVIYVTSAIKGEGKTLTGFNLALAYASFKKKVLMVGGDLRNPQLHTYLDILKKSKGLPEYLSDESLPWEKVVNEGFSGDLNIKVCYSRQIPPNAPELLASDRFTEFIEQAREEFDYIIVDTAPTLLVTDTMLISQHADLTLFVTRAGFTEQRLLEYAKDINKSGKLKNMAFVLNDVGLGKGRHYNYGYDYGYGSK